MHISHLQSHNPLTRKRFGDQDLNAFMIQVGVEDLRQDINRLKAFNIRHLNSILYTEKCVHEINGSYTFNFYWL
jgi:hypothetical protein